jgi:hypothetical protein
VLPRLSSAGAQKLEIESYLLKYDPLSLLAREKLMLLHLEEGNTKNALLEYELIKKLDSQFYPPLKAATLLFESQKYSESKKILDQLLRAEPGNLDARKVRAVVLFELKQFQKSYEDLQYFAKNGNESDQSYLIASAKTLHVLKDIDRARGILQSNSTETFTLPAVNDTAVAMYKSGSTYFPVILVLDSTNATTTAGLKSAMFNPSTSTWSNVRDSSPIFTLGASDGNALTADFDLNGNIVATFWDITSTRLKYVQSSNGGSTWTTAYNVTASAVVEFASVRINRYNGYPAVAYFDRANNRSYYSICSNSASSCASGGWAETLLEANLGISGLTTSTGQVLGTGVAFSSSGNPSVFFSTGQGGLGGLRKCEASGSNFSCSTVSEGRGGNTPSAVAVNYAISGWSVDANANDSGGTTAAYIGPGGWLYQYSCK